MDSMCLNPGVAAYTPSKRHSPAPEWASPVAQLILWDPQERHFWLLFSQIFHSVILDSTVDILISQKQFGGRQKNFVKYISAWYFVPCTLSHLIFTASLWGRNYYPHLKSGESESWRLNDLPKAGLLSKDHGQCSKPRATSVSLEPTPLRSGCISLKMLQKTCYHNNYYSFSSYNVQILFLRTEYLSSSARIKRRITFFPNIKRSLLNRTKSFFKSLNNH